MHLLIGWLSLVRLLHGVTTKIKELTTFKTCAYASSLKYEVSTRFSVPLFFCRVETFIKALVLAWLGERVRNPCTIRG